MKKAVYLILLIFISSHSVAQNTRTNTYHSIGWYNYIGVFNVSSKIGIHTEYQFRREEFISNWQQSLLRIGMSYSLSKKTIIRLGYAWVETFSYGEIPINNFNKDFTEHRIFQMVQLNNKENKIEFTHRFMFEQRFIGRYLTSESKSEDVFSLLYRMRYMFRIQIPLKGSEIKNKTPYLALYDELFIGFGKNVNENIFDQNRIGLLIGYRISKTLRLEAGYINQILQLGREVNNSNVFQYNNGIIININLGFDFFKKKSS
ncbi:MAG: DUF2490 domain-containing protein [Cytophagaceae bacterium]|jgi:hypothetical protein|nr:DUF2490 domain-containing protein [Cytophagaceae bacterium]